MVRYQVSNLSASGGDPVYSVASDVTFKNLTLTGIFTDNTTLNIPLFDASGIQKTSLDTSTILLESENLLLPDSTHGGLEKVTLSGLLDPTTLDIMTSFGGSTVSVTVDSLLQGTLNNPMTTGSINLYAVTANGDQYGIGTLDVSAIPEPASLVLLTTGLGLLLGTGLRLSPSRREGK